MGGKGLFEEVQEGTWKVENTEEALKCWKLERIIDAALIGESMDEFAGDCAGNTISTTKEI